MPSLSKEKIKVFTANNAQPIIKPYLRNSKNKKYPEQSIHPNKKLPIFFSNMHCIYPEDRGQNFSVKFAIKVAKAVDNYLLFK